MTPDVVLVRRNARKADAAGRGGPGDRCRRKRGHHGVARLRGAARGDQFRAPAASFRCIGNRVSTGAGDTEAYVAIPGGQVGAVEESLGLTCALTIIARR